MGSCLPSIRNFGDSSLRLLGRIFDHRVGVELDVRQFPIYPLDPANVLVVDDVRNRSVSC
jgi:hypothetical protein